MTDAPTPRPLPPERWVVEINGSYWGPLPSRHGALVLANIAARVDGNEVWLGPLRQFRVDDSPIDGQGPGEDEG